MKIKLSFRTVENDGGTVIGASCFLGGGEGTEPFSRAFSGFSDLGYPFTPAPLPYPSVSELVIIRTTFAFRLFAIGGTGGAVTTVCGAIISAVSDGVLGRVRDRRFIH